jgi:hypothetical protein
LEVTSQRDLVKFKRFLKEKGELIFPISCLLLSEAKLSANFTSPVPGSLDTKEGRSSNLLLSKRGGIFFRLFCLTNPALE